LSAATLRSLRAVAARHSRVAHEVDDVIQDVLLAAVAEGRDIADPGFAAWAAGAVRLRSRFLARTAARRFCREQAYAASPQPTRQRPALRLPKTFVDRLPPSRRIVALLVNLGMDRREVGYLLGLSDVALRQRIAGLRKAAKAEGLRPLPVLERGTEPHRGLVRRALKAALPPRTIRQFAVRDPDGMTILVSGGHVLEGGGN
jgi:RNA polymerase sigma-70 factor (ECF subfamily)